MSGNFFGGQFFGGGFFGVLASTTDTHDGGKPWHQKVEFINARAASYRLDHKKLADDIRSAMETPAEGEVLDIIRSEMEPDELKALSAPDFEPELKGLLSQTEALRKIARIVMEEHARQEQDDEEEAIMLLIH